MRAAVLLGEDKQDTRERRKSSLHEGVSFCVDTKSGRLEDFVMPYKIKCMLQDFLLRFFSN